MTVALSIFHNSRGKKFKNTQPHSGKTYDQEPVMCRGLMDVHQAICMCHSDG